MLASLFNPESPFWRKIGAFADILALSLLWVFTSLPIVTLGAATTALYDASARCVRRGLSGALSRYFSTFRREFKASVILTLIYLVGFFVLLLPLRFFWLAMTLDLTGSSIAFASYAIFLILPLGAFCWVFPILSRFSFSLLGALKVSVQCSIAYLPITFLMVLSAVGAGLVSALYWVPVLILPCLVALLWTCLLERIFAKYISSGPDTEEE